MSGKKILAKKLKQERIKQEEEKLADAMDTDERVFRASKIRQLEEGLQKSHFEVPTLNFGGLFPLSMGDFEGDEDDDDTTKQIEEEVGNVGSELIKPVLQQKPKKQRGDLNIDVASIVKRAFSSKKTLF